VAYHIVEPIHGDVWVIADVSTDGTTKVCGNEATGSGKRVPDSNGSVVLDGTVTLSPGIYCGRGATCGDGPLSGQPLPQTTHYLMTYLVEVQSGMVWQRVLAQESYPWT
jgi:hypothetical protein